MSRWKLFKMDIVKKMRWERPLDFDLSESQNMPVVSQDAPKPTDSLTSILRLVQTDADASVSVMSWNTLVFASSGLVSAVMTNARDNSNNVDGSLFFRLNSSQSSS